MIYSRWGEQAMGKSQPLNTTRKCSDQTVGCSHYNSHTDTNGFHLLGLTKCQMVSLCAISHLIFTTIL